MTHLYTDLFIAKFSFWPYLSASQKMELSDQTQLRQFKKGEILYESKETCLGVVLIKTGQLRAYILSEDGREVTLYRLFPGDVGILTASCVLQAVSYHVFVEADADTQVLLTASEIFGKLVENNIYVRCFAYEMASARLSEMLWALQQILFLSADKRLALFLLEESKKKASDRLLLTQEQIASYMGSAREVVSRLLKYFAAEKIVRSERGSVTILDRKKLEQLVG